MSNNFPQWLTEPMLKGIKTFNLDAFLLALEGWRRGLTLTWYYDVPDEIDMKLIGFNTIGKIFSLTDGDKTHYFYRSRGDLVTTEAVEIAGDKQLTKEMLIDLGIRTPKGKGFNYESSVSEMVNYFEEQDTPVVVKPTHGSLGTGVSSNIKTRDELIEAITYIREELNYQDIVIEEFVQGYDTRVYVVGNEVVAATKRLPPFVTGDGKSTIEELIKQKNEERKKNPHLSTRLIKINKRLTKYLSKLNYSLSTVPKMNENVNIGDKANISSGGESFNVLDSLPEHAKNLAIDTVNKVPGLMHAGIDIMVDESSSQVIEINSTAGIVLHILPYQGDPSFVEKKIIDYYFPETKNVYKNYNLYFNYNNIAELLRNRAVNKAEVTNAINEQIITKRFIVKGEVQGVGYRNWVRRQAAKLELNGYVRNLKNGNVVVVVGSTDEDKIFKFKDQLFVGPVNANVENVVEKDWDKQLNIGFEIRRK